MQDVGQLDRQRADRALHGVLSRLEQLLGEERVPAAAARDGAHDARVDRRAELIGEQFGELGAAQRPELEHRD